MGGAAAVAALLPIGLIVGLMVGRRWAAAPAGLVGLAAALPVALLVFGWRGPDAAGGVGWALAGVGAEAGFSALTILWIVFPALCIHELQLASGATETLRRARAAADRSRSSSPSSRRAASAGTRKAAALARR